MKRKAKAVLAVKRDWRKDYMVLDKRLLEINVGRNQESVKISDLEMTVANQDKRIDRLIRILENISVK